MIFHVIPTTFEEKQFLTQYVPFYILPICVTVRMRLGLRVTDRIRFRVVEVKGWHMIKVGVRVNDNGRSSDLFSVYVEHFYS